MNKETGAFKSGEDLTSERAAHATEALKLHKMSKTAEAVPADERSDEFRDLVSELDRTLEDVERSQLPSILDKALEQYGPRNEELKSNIKTALARTILEAGLMPDDLSEQTITKAVSKIMGYGQTEKDKDILNRDAEDIKQDFQKIDGLQPNLKQAA
jgi:hypothetical protein